MLPSLLLLCVISVLIFYLFWKPGTKTYAKPEPEKFKGWLPLIGHAHKVIGDTAHLWEYVSSVARICLKDGTGAKTMNMGPNWKVYLLTSADDCYKVATTCLSKDRVYDLAKPWIGNGLVTGTVPIWKRHRKLLNPAFTQKILDGYICVFNQYGKELADKFNSKAGKGFCDLHGEIQSVAFGLNCATTMGLNDNLSEADSKKIRVYMESVNQYMHYVVTRSQNVWMQNELLYSLSSMKLKEKELRNLLKDMTTSVINKKKEELRDTATANDGTPKSFLQYMIGLTEESGFTEDELREEADTFIAAGFDTTSYFVLVALVVIGSFPEVQQRIYDEILEVLDGSDRDIGKDDLLRLVYLNAVLKEVLRLYPIFGFISRHIDQDIELKDYTLRAGASCFLFLWAVNRDPLTWGEDADQFKPERFLDRASHPEETNCFASFSFGQRSCIGAKFSIMVGKVLVAQVLRRYQLFADYTKMKFKMDIVVCPFEGYDLRIEHRNSENT